MREQRLVLDGAEPHAAKTEGKRRHEAIGVRELVRTQGPEQAFRVDIAGDLRQTELLEQTVLREDEVNDRPVRSLASRGEACGDAEALGKQTALADLALNGELAALVVLLRQTSAKGAPHGQAIEYALTHGERRGARDARASLGDVEDLVDERGSVRGDDAIRTNREIREGALPRRDGAGNEHGIRHERGGVVCGRGEKVGVTEREAQVGARAQGLGHGGGVDGAGRHRDVNHAVERRRHGDDGRARLPGGGGEEDEREDVRVADDDNRVIGRHARGSELVIEAHRVGELAALATRRDIADGDGEPHVDERASKALHELARDVVAGDKERVTGLAGDGLGCLAELVCHAGTDAHVAGTRAQHDGLAADGHDDGLGLQLVTLRVAHRSPFSQRRAPTS